MKHFTFDDTRRGDAAKVALIIAATVALGMSAIVLAAARAVGAI